MSCPAVTRMDGMAKKKEVDIDMVLEELMQRWPATISVFLRHRMLCIGCPISGFHTLVDAAREHGIDLDMLLEEVEEAMAERPGGGAPTRPSCPR